VIKSKFIKATEGELIDFSEAGTHLWDFLLSLSLSCTNVISHEYKQMRNIQFA